MARRMRYSKPGFIMPDVLCGMEPALLDGFLQQMHLEMRRSMGSKDRRGSGNHFHVRSTGGNHDGRLRWRMEIVMTTPMRIATGERKEIRTKGPATERPKTMPGRRKKVAIK